MWITYVPTNLTEQFRIETAGLLNVTCGQHSQQCEKMAYTR